ncbi:MAG TPA: hypothetical protein VFE32_22225 [Puia sp.]|jgi:hypothetical protein|nr:hypothetical protein [Puia sp.]
MQRYVGILLISLLISASLKAQDTLPRFTATARGPGKILISWHNQYPVVTQISIQRSADSLRNFATLLTVPDPKLPENGAVDSKAPHPNFFYRLFIVFDNGQYLFTPSHRPQSVTGQNETVAREDKAAEKVLAKAVEPRIVFIDPSAPRQAATIRNLSGTHGAAQISDVAYSATIFIRRGDSIIGKVSGKQILPFRDSILNRTRDTLIFIDGDTLWIKPFVPLEVYKISAYVYTGKYGNVHVSLPEAGRKHYSVRFFDENNKLMFELSEIKDPTLIVDKTNFQHAGWFRFELYDGDQLKEKNKLFIPKEF